MRRPSTLRTSIGRDAAVTMTEIPRGSYLAAPARLGKPRVVFGGWCVGVCRYVCAIIRVIIDALLGARGPGYFQMWEAKK